ncbi:MAG: hypothetical protein HZB38_13580 [Planctomycetes bacterium]|nr:hypothetical protein [Planctomycetota bacterium]
MTDTAKNASAAGGECKPAAGTLRGFIRRRWRWLLLGSATLTLLSLLGLFFAVTCKPAWYQPAAVDYRVLDDDKRVLTNLADEIGDNLNARNAFDVRITQDQLNRWIAARREVPEIGVIDIEPFSQPYVDVLPDGAVRIGAIIRHESWRVVAALAARLDVQPDALRISLQSVHAGYARAPAAWIVGPLASALSRAGGSRTQIQDDVLLIPNDFTWPNGKVRFRISRIQTTDDEAIVSFEPR